MILMKMKMTNLIINMMKLIIKLMKLTINKTKNYKILNSKIFLFN